MYLSSQTIDPKIEFSSRAHRGARTGTARLKAAEKRNNPTKRFRREAADDTQNHRADRAVLGAMKRTDRLAASTQSRAARQDPEAVEVIGAPCVSFARSIGKPLAPVKKFTA